MASILYGVRPTNTLLNLSSGGTLALNSNTFTLTTALTNQGAAGVLNWSGATTLTIPNATGTAALINYANAGTLAGTTLYSGNGATATPSITFTADTATGLYLYPSTHHIGFTSNGTTFAAMGGSNGWRYNFETHLDWFDGDVFAGNLDLIVWRAAPRTLGLKLAGTKASPQPMSFVIDNFNDNGGLNREIGWFTWESNTLKIKTTALGTGVVEPISIEGSLLLPGSAVNRVPFYDATNGYVTGSDNLRYFSASSLLQTVGNITALSNTYTTFRAVSYVDNGYPIFELNRARGSISAPTPILQDFEMGQFAFGGYDAGSAFRDRLTITGYAEQNWGNGANLGTYLAIATTNHNAAAPTEKVRLSANGYLGVGVTAPAAYLHPAASTTTAASLRVPDGTAPTSPVEGDQWNDSTQKANVDFVDGIKQSRVGCIFTQTADVTVASTASETTLIGTGVGTVTLPANFFTVGKTIRIGANGHYSTANPAGTLQIKVKLGTTVILDTTAATMTNGLSNLAWTIAETVITCRTTGATGTVMGQGYAEFSTTHTATTIDDFTPNTTAVTIDTTASQAISITAQWGTSSASNTITATNITVEVLN